MGLIRVATAYPRVSSYTSDTVYGIMTPGELVKELRTATA